MERFLILGTAFLSTSLFAFSLLPPAMDRYRTYLAKKAKKTSDELENMFIESNTKNLTWVLMLSPLVVSVFIYIIFKNFLLVIAAAAVSLILPSLILRTMDKARKSKFKSQIIDNLMIIASSLKAGLTMLQTMQVLVEESSSPTKEEFNLLLKENKMGSSLEESLTRLAQRMESEEIDMLVSAISFAHYTGGNLAELIDRLVTTIREKNKLDAMVKTLTLQGKLQGRIMSLLPLIFGVAITAMNKDYFKTMLETDIGRSLIVAAVVLELIGLFLINKMSKVEV